MIFYLLHKNRHVRTPVLVKFFLGAVDRANGDTLVGAQVVENVSVEDVRDSGDGALRVGGIVVSWAGNGIILAEDMDFTSNLNMDVRFSYRQKKGYSIRERSRGTFRVKWGSNPSRC